MAGGIPSGGGKRAYGYQLREHPRACRNNVHPVKYGNGENQEILSGEVRGQCLGETRETRLVNEAQMKCGLDAAEVRRSVH